MFEIVITYGLVNNIAQYTSDRVDFLMDQVGHLPTMQIWMERLRKIP